jgi:hypothetical protein
MSARKGRCRICGKPADHGHHAAGVVHLPDFKVSACLADHDFQHAEFRRWGVPLSHKHTPSQIENVYAFIAGLSGVVREAIANVGTECADDVQTLDHVTSALLLDTVTAQSPDKRTFGPEPLAQAGRKARPPRRTTISPDELGVHMADLERFLAAGAQQMLGGVEGTAEHVTRMSAIGEHASEATAWFLALADERGSELARVFEANREAGVKLAAAVRELDSDPTPEQLAAVADPGRHLLRFGQCYYRLHEALAMAGDREQARDAIDVFIGELNDS